AAPPTHPSENTLLRGGLRACGLVSIVVPCSGRPSRGSEAREYRLARCLASIRHHSTYPNYEIIVVHNGELPGDLASQAALQGAQTVVCTEAFNRASARNAGVARSRGRQFLFLHEDVEIVTPNWLEAMLEYATQPDIGVVGG